MAPMPSPEQMFQQVRIYDQQQSIEQSRSQARQAEMRQHESSMAILMR